MRWGGGFISEVAFLPLLSDSYGSVFAGRDGQESANSCLSEPAEIAPERSSPRSSIIMLIFGLFIGG